MLPVPTGPTSIAITADGSTAYVSCRFGNTILPISLDGSEAPPPRLGIGTSGVAVTPDSKLLLSAGDGVLDILDAHSLVDVGFALTDARAAAVAVTPDQAPRASLRISIRQGKKVTLDRVRLVCTVNADRHLRLGLRRRNHRRHHWRERHPQVPCTSKLHSGGDAH